MDHVRNQHPEFNHFQWKHNGCAGELGVLRACVLSVLLAGFYSDYVVAAAAQRQSDAMVPVIGGKRTRTMGPPVSLHDAAVAGSRGKKAAVTTGPE